MSSGVTDLRAVWNRRYSEGRRSKLHTTLLRFYHLAKIGRALDVACGTGENAIFLAKKGFQVDAVDISDVAVRIARRNARREGVRVSFKSCPAEVFSWRPERYDLIINFYFLDRRIIPKMVRSLKRGGLLIFETYNTSYLNVKPDFNPEFLLRHGEILELTKPFLLC